MRSSLKLCCDVFIRQDAQTARDKLQKILVEMLRVTCATEEHVNRKLGTCGSGARSGEETPNARTTKTSCKSHEPGAFVTLLLVLSGLVAGCCCDIC